MPHRTFTAGDVDYITRLNALASSLDRRLAQNILINGTFQVWQRGTSFAASGSARVVAADRWHFWRSTLATGATVSRQTGNAPSRYCARVQRDSGNASTAVVNFGQPLTSENSIALRGKRLGVRFAARAGADYSSSGSQLKVQIQTGTGTDQAITGFTSSATTLLASVTLATSWQYFTADLGGTVGGSITQLALILGYTPVGTASTNDWFEVQEVQMVPTTDSNVDVGDYPLRSFEEELGECLPYFEKSFPYATTPAQNTGAFPGAAALVQSVGAAVTSYGTVNYSRRKRAAVTPTLYNPAAANAEIRNGSRSNDWSSSVSAQASEIGFVLQGTTSAGSAAGDISFAHWTADAEL